MKERERMNKKLEVKQRSACLTHLRLWVLSLIPAALQQMSKNP
jgi:hypothetical protein